MPPDEAATGGGADPRCRVHVQQQDFDPGALIEAMRGGGHGAIVSFVGVAREFNDGFPVDGITLEHYPGMTEKSLADIAGRALQRWNLGALCIVHRFGTLAPGDRIVLVAAASPHRDAAFEACRFVVDLLKTQAPFWKRESGPQGARWVPARESDERALERWREPGSE